MGYLFLADLVVICHTAFILFALLGGLLLWWQRWWGWIHVPAFVWSGIIELTGGICPLTHLEYRLRILGRGDTYRGDFINHYVIPLLYPESLTREIQIVLGACVILLNVGLYANFWHTQWWQKKKTG